MNSLRNSYSNTNQILTTHYDVTILPCNIDLNVRGDSKRMSVIFGHFLPPSLPPVQACPNLPDPLPPPCPNFVHIYFLTHNPSLYHHVVHDPYLIIREYQMKKGHNQGKICYKLIPSLIGPYGSLESPKKSLKKSGMAKLGFWATPFYLYFQPGAKTTSTLKIGVETNLRALK